MDIADVDLFNRMKSQAKHCIQRDALKSLEHTEGKHWRRVKLHVCGDLRHDFCPKRCACRGPSQRVIIRKVLLIERESDLIPNI